MWLCLHVVEFCGFRVVVLRKGPAIVTVATLRCVHVFVCVHAWLRTAPATTTNGVFLLFLPLLLGLLPFNNWCQGSRMLHAHEESLICMALEI